MGFFESAFAVVLGGGVGVFCGLVGIGYLQTYWQVSRSPPTDTREVREAGRQVELAGTVAPHGDVPHSPFTESESPVHKWTIVESRPGNDTDARKIDFGERTEPFVLEDGTGEALIDSEGAQVELTRSTDITVEPDESPPPAVAEYIEQTEGVSPDHEETRFYRESLLELGSAVHVYGPVQKAMPSFDHPAGVDAEVGVENPDERAIKLGEDDLGTIVEKTKSDDSRFVVSSGDEGDAEQRLLKSGLTWLGFGLLFTGLCLTTLVLG